MKVLIIGGASQGKRDYAEREYGLAGAFAPPDAEPEEALAAPAIDGLHMLVRQIMERGGDPAQTVLAALEGREEWYIICDEIGCGVVPLDAFDRRWREQTGRLCCELAGRADIVERISCGLAVRLKGQAINEEEFLNET